jgi:carboxyl-terminal processing protease
MGQKIRYVVLGALIAFLGIIAGEKVGLITSPYIEAESKAYLVDEDIFKYMDIIGEIWVRLKENYVGKVDKEKVFIGAMKGMLSALNDPYTRFLDEKELKELNIDVSGEFGGLGIEITIRDGWITVVSPIEGTPAYRAGIKPGDKIVEIEGKTTKNMSLWEAVSKLRGKPGTPVNIKIMREGVPNLIPMKIVRDIIKIKSVKYALIDYNGVKVGYVKLVRFSVPSFGEMARTIEILKNRGMKALILDLRNNPGGVLEGAVSIASLFLKRGSVIVSVKGKLSRFSRVYRSRNEPMLPLSMPIVVMINGGSASASEIVAGALRDNKRAILLGTKSFGKGSVQQEIKLQESSGRFAIMVTIAKYYTPSGVCIHGKGIKPDIEVKLPSPTDEERLVMKIIEDKKFIAQFSKQHPSYSEETVKSFSEFLSKRHLSLRPYFIRFMLKHYYNRKKIPPVYDLDLDIQLKKALDVVYKKVI